MSAATSKQKKSVGKDDLRRLMKQHKQKSSSSAAAGINNSSSGSSSQAALINSPLAKYNSLGQLSCVVCGCVVKSALLWSSHILSRAHKENVVRLKDESGPRVGPAAPSSSLPSGKRKAADEGEYEGNGKISRVSAGVSQGSVSSSVKHTHSSNVPTDFFDNQPSSSRQASKGSTVSLTSSAGSLVVSRLAEYSDASDDNDDDDRVDDDVKKQSHSSDSRLPTDFFDSSASSATGSIAAASADEPTRSKTSLGAMKEKLPEGFFDDPVKDAKVREVEYKDKMEEEWESFQKSMKVEAVISEALEEEDDQEREAERNLDEIDDQMNRWRRVDELQKRKDSLMHSATQSRSSGGDSAAAQNCNKSEDDMEQDEDEDDLELQLDWRSKTA